MSTEQRIEILSAEYIRCLNDPLYSEPEKYCIVLDLIYDELERLGFESMKIQKLTESFGEV